MSRDTECNGPAAKLGTGGAGACRPATATRSAWSSSGDHRGRAAGGSTEPATAPSGTVTTSVRAWPAVSALHEVGPTTVSLVPASQDGDEHPAAARRYDSGPMEGVQHLCLIGVPGVAGIPVFSPLNSDRNAEVTIGGLHGNCGSGQQDYPVEAAHRPRHYAWVGRLLWPDRMWTTLIPKYRRAGRSHPTS